MTTTNRINSNFHQIAITDINGNVTGVQIDELSVSTPSTFTLGGGSNGQVLSTDGAGSLSWITVSTGNVANADYANISGIAYSVDAANINGTIPFATISETSNSVAAANVVGEVANATYANISGIAYSVDGSNVVGEVANATYSTTSNNSTSLTANVSNVKINGGTSGQVLSTDGSGNTGWITVAATTLVNGTSSVNIPLANAGVSFNIGGTVGVLLVNRIASSLGANWIPTATNTYSLGNTTFKWREVFSSTVKLTPQTTAALGSAATAGAGTKAFVTDSSVGTWGSTLVAGGSFAVPVYSNGSVWIVG